MKTCKDCIHYKICKEYDADYSEYYMKLVLFDGYDITALCEDFEDLSRYVKPPVEIGQTVWRVASSFSLSGTFTGKPVDVTVTEISQKTIRGLPSWGFIAGGTRYKFDSIGKTVFLSYEDAAKSLEDKS